MTWVRIKDPEGTHHRAAGGHDLDVAASEVGRVRRTTNPCGSERRPPSLGPRGTLRSAATSASNAPTAGTSVDLGLSERFARNHLGTALRRSALLAWFSRLLA